MQLGIVVVYLVKDEDEELLRVHLSQINELTTVPYKIYAGVNRLQPKFRQILEADEKTRICQLPQTDLRISEEHAFYLEHLFQLAIDDGATHVAVLHVDSFPVRQGWARELAVKLKEGCAFAAIMRKENHDLKPNLMCLLFPREFYLTYSPKLSLTQEERSSAGYQKYCQEIEHCYDTGVGYGFLAYQRGLSWHPLLKSNPDRGHPLIAAVYGDMIFHLGAAARDDKIFNLDTKQSPPGFMQSVLDPGYRALRSIIPALKKHDWAWFIRLHRRSNEANQAVYLQARQELFADPRAYLQRIRH